MTNYTLLIAILACAGAMLLCTKKEKKQIQWTGKYICHNQDKNYKIILRQKSNKEIELSLDAGEKGKLNKVTAFLVEEDTAIYTTRDGQTVIMKMEDGKLSVTEGLGCPYYLYDRLSSNA